MKHLLFIIEVVSLTPLSNLTLESLKNNVEDDSAQIGGVLACGLTAHERSCLEMKIGVNKIRDLKKDNNAMLSSAISSS